MGIQFNPTSYNNSLDYSLYSLEVFLQGKFWSQDLSPDQAIDSYRALYIVKERIRYLLSDMDKEVKEHSIELIRQFHQEEKSFFVSTGHRNSLLDTYYPEIRRQTTLYNHLLKQVILAESRIKLYQERKLEGTVLPGNDHLIVSSHAGYFHIDQSREKSCGGSKSIFSAQWFSTDVASYKPAMCYQRNIPKCPRDQFKGELQRELNLSHLLSSDEGFLRFLFCFKFREELYAITPDYGIDLSNFLISDANETKQHIAPIIWHVLQCVARLHRKGILHVDLKPENFFLGQHLVQGDVGPGLVLGDFGYAVNLAQGETLKKTLGTRDYIAPEVWHTPAQATYKADVWSLGALCYLFYCKLYRTDPPDLEPLAELVKSPLAEGETSDERTASVHAYLFPDPADPYDSFRELICKMLVIDPEKRISAQEAASLLG
ncbi:MAG: serine/threonine-protein kinase [Verrucomicrobia bacterium]|nr:serine/threonine-protein kinase [Verrucomicrobiota bacterium]